MSKLLDFYFFLSILNVYLGIFHPLKCQMDTGKEKIMKHEIRKRIITTILSLVTLLQLFCVGLVTPVSAATNSRFSDVSVGQFAVNEQQKKTEKITQEHFDAINYMFDNGIMIGTGDGLFSPGIALSRAMVVTVLYRLQGEPSTGVSSFHDLTDTWYMRAVAWGQSTGIVKGISKTEFAPNRDVDRREAITFLYRYAQVYHGQSPVTVSSIQNRPDYMDIEWEDAQEAIQWAMDNGILKGDQNTHIKPKEKINRMTFALYVYRMNINVLGIQESDRHNSQNHPNEFKISFTDKYQMADHELQMLTQGLSYMDLLIIYKKIGSENTGICLGMAITCVLDKTGKIAFNENVTYGAETMRDVPKFMDLNNQDLVITKSDNKKISRAVSLINYYQLIQCLSKYDTEVGVKKTFTKDDAVNLVLSQSYGGVAVFSFSYVQAGVEYQHAVVMHGMPEYGAEGITLRIYDPNYNTCDRYIRISNSFSTCTYEYNYNGKIYKREIKAFNYIKPDKFDSFDIDGPKNELPDGGQNKNSKSILKTASKSQLGNEALIFFDAYGELSITNSNGQKLHYKDGVIDGTMEILDVKTIANGPEYPATYILTVKKSKTYNCAATSKEMDMLIIDADKYASIDGTGANKIEIAAKGVTIYGNDMDVEVISSVGCSEDRHLRITAENETKISISNIFGNIDVTTNNEASTVVENSGSHEMMHKFEKDAGKITIRDINTDAPSLLEFNVEGSIANGLTPLG